jgi:hypothetical protein
VLLVVLLWPWPGLAGVFSQAASFVCDAIAGIEWGRDSQIHFIPSRYEPEHPWWVSMTIKNVFTGQSLEMPVDTRTLGYIRIAVFAALAIAWPFWTTKRVAGATACGFVLLLGGIAFSLVLPIVQVLGIVKVLSLGVLTQSMVSIGILTLATYPGMAFAIPALIWLFVMRFAHEHPLAGSGGCKNS